MPARRTRKLELINPYVVLALVPPCSGFLLGIWILLRDNVTTDELARDFIDLIVLTLFGALATAGFWALERRSEKRRAAGIKEQYEVVKEAMGLIPSTETVRGLVGDQPDLFLNFLAQERTKQENGFKLLKESSRWPLTTPRAYETIIEFIKQADDFVIVDQDLRRWFEILDTEEGQNADTSTTFNYSQYILDITRRRLAVDRDLASFRRVFMVNDRVLQCLREEDKQKSWAELPPATRVLLKIWEFERRLFDVAGVKSGTDIGSRVILVRKHPASPTLHDEVHKYKDIVLVNGEVCFQEDLLWEAQGSPKTSFLTESWLVSGGDFVKGSADYFETVWKRAKGWRDYPEYHPLLEGMTERILDD